MPKSYRLNKVIKELNITVNIAADFLASKGIEIERNLNTKIEQDIYDVLVKQFQADRKLKEAAEEVDINKLRRQEQKERELRLQEEKKREELRKKEAEKLKKEKEEAEKKARKAAEKATKKAEEAKPADETPAEQPEASPSPAEAATESAENTISGRKKLAGLKTIGKIDLSPNKTEKAETPKNTTPAEPKEEPKPEEQPTATEEPKTESPEPEAPKAAEEPTVIETKYQKLEGITKIGKIDLSKFDDKKKKDKKEDADKGAKRKRKRIRKNAKPETASNNSAANNNKGGANRKAKKPAKKDVSELTEEEVQKQIKETLEKLTNKGNKKTNKGAKHRREKRKFRREQEEQELQQQANDRVLNVTEFVSVNEIASLMDVSVMDIISACMSLGVMVTMNQRLDANTIELVADEFGFAVNFTDAEIDNAILDTEEDSEEDLQPRAPIVTVMGHVDHGKTSLLDYIREENVIAGESGGITQHIGAYSVQLENGKTITFLDTPGHEAFTAMRARGAQITDIAIIVIAADDQIMPQTEEAISHAQAAGVPMIFAINKIDKPTANPDKVKEQLANMNLLVEDWGGKIQSQDISAKTGQNVEELLEKVLLEAEMLELKANPNREASGTVIEAALDKGRGYVATIVVQNGTLRVGDYVLAGSNHGKVRAMLNERGTNIKEAGPATPVTILGLDGAPTAGDKFRVFEDEREAKQLASKREQLQREQTIRTQKHITLDEIGRRIALGDFQELNIVLKGDVDGSVEALTDSLQKLSTDEIHVNILHKGVGQITESDVLLASASDAIIIGFNVRPNASARNIAEKEEVEIRTYSIIYDAINEVKEAMEGMLSPELKEEVIGNVEIRQTFKISKVGTIAGCMVLDGKITRNSNVRIIRDGVVVHTGELASLKRYKDDVKEVTKGYECGLNIKNYNDIREGDMIEVYVINEVKKKLK